MLATLSRRLVFGSRCAVCASQKIGCKGIAAQYRSSTPVLSTSPVYLITRKFSQASETEKLQKDFFHICGKGDIEQAKKMLKEGWEVDARDKAEATALMWASTEGHLPMVKYLIEKGANLDAKNNIGRTALWYAIWKGHMEVALHLKDAGADINTTDVDGNSLLHLAADEGKIEYVKLLLDWGVDVHIINWDGLQAKDLAQDKQVRELLNKDIDFTYY